MFVQLAAWCKTPAAKQAARCLKRPGVLPAAKGPLYAFEKWDPIWSAGSYTLRDFGEQDVQGCSRLLIDAIGATYSGVKAAVEREYGAGWDLAVDHVARRISVSNFDRLHTALQHHIVNSLGWASCGRSRRR